MESDLLLLPPFRGDPSSIHHVDTVQASFKHSHTPSHHCTPFDASNPVEVSVSKADFGQKPLQAYQESAVSFFAMAHLVSEITDLRIYPIKSCRGISLPSAKLTRQGLELDRRWMVSEFEANLLQSTQIS